MTHLFLSKNAAALKKLITQRTLFAFDLDGTLAPIVADPAHAGIPKTTLTLLCKLSTHTPVAVISGRSLRDLKHRTSGNFAHLVGNHGIEGIAEFRTQSIEARGTCKKWAQALRRNGEGLDAGVVVEDKLYSLSLHYRMARDRARARKKLIDLADNFEPQPRIVPGKCVLNLVPQNMPHKGTALVALMKQLRVKQALFIGDDQTDEDVFGMISPRGLKIMTVRVGKKTRSKAQFYIRSQGDVERLLRAINEGWADELSLL